MSEAAIVLWAFGAALLSFVICSLLSRFKILSLGDAKMQADTTALQALHSRPTPRVGGGAVLTAFAVVVFLNRDQLGVDLLLALLAGLVIFVVGLKEDIFRNVSPRARLLAAMISGALAMALTAGMVPSLHPRVDPAFGFVALPILVTLIWSAGTCHALNLIDGLNGLSSSYAMVATTAIVVIAMQTGDLDLQFTGLVLIAALLGFFVLNWPYARIFMGDAGAYAIGHALTWLGIVLMARNPQVSPIAVLLVLFWPVADTTWSIIRRRIMKRAINQPDRMHFHHIVIRLIARLSGKPRSDEALNPLATLMLFPFFSLPALMGVMFWNKPDAALISLAAFTLLFLVGYGLAVSFLANPKTIRRHAVKARVEDPPQAAQPVFAQYVSKLGGTVVKESVSIEVRIVRMKQHGPWQLITQSGSARDRKWSRQFRTDEEAWLFFLKTLETDGMQSLVGDVQPMAETKLQAS